MGPVPPRNLPAEFTRLVGREQDVAAVEDVVLNAQTPLVTLTGIGGCGKTRLAVEIGERLLPAFAGGVWFIALDSITDERLIPQTVAMSLGLPEAPGSSFTSRIAGALANSSALLILDNCEHLIDATATLIAELLGLCPGLRILATSREPLQISGERQYHVEPLAVPAHTSLSLSDELMWYPSVELFVDRAQSVDPRFGLTQANAEAVAEICTRLEGIPLAIELAAARARSLSAHEILERLDNAFRILHGSHRSLPVRQQTLEATMDWSYDLLTEVEQGVFNRLSCFAGGCDLQAIEAVVVGSWPEVGDCNERTDVEILDELSRLVEKSLVTIERDGAVTRYRMLEPVRQYAARRLTESGVDTRTREAHAQYYLSFAETAAPKLLGVQQTETLAQIARDQDNFRLALQWFDEQEDAASLMRLAIALFPFWRMRNRYIEGRAWLQTAIQAATESEHACPAGQVASALRAAGLIAFMQYDMRSSEEFAEQSLRICREVGDRLGIAGSLSVITLVAGLRRDHERARTMGEQSLTLAREIGDRATLAFALLASGYAANERGDVPATRMLLGESISLFQEIHEAQMMAVASTVLGVLELRESEYHRAAQHFRSALTTHHQNGNRWMVIYGIINVGRTLAATRQAAVAARLLGAAQGLGTGLGDVLAPIGAESARKLLETLKFQLNATDLETMLAEGRSLSQVDAVTLAVEALDRLQRNPDRSKIAARTNDGVERLTRREREVAALLARGLSDREIADELFITPGTVGVHVHNILAKLHVTSRRHVSGKLEERASPSSHLPD